MSAVLHAFPSFQGINARSFALAFIIVLHVALYAAFTSINPPRRSLVPDDIEIVDIKPQPKPIPTPTPVGGEGVQITAVVPTGIDVPNVPIDPSGWDVPSQEPTHVSFGDDGAGSAPVIVEPQIDARIGLREPPYPASEIRLNHTGTVVLSVEVLSNGTVGNVRLVRSSGYPKLDEAALRVARTWRLIPGTRDGTAAAMWKQVPITFRLQN